MREILSYEKFKEEVKNKVQQQAVGYKVEERRAEINNGVYREELICKSEVENLVPIIPLKELYSVYLDVGMDDIVRRVLAIFTFRYHVEKDNIIKKWEEVKDKVLLELVNAKWNQECLKSVPHMRMWDFALVMRLGLWEDEENRRATCLITHEMMEKWEIDLDELFDTALLNFQREEYDIKTIDDMLAELQTVELQKEMLGMPADEVEMYVLTNKCRYKGAVGMLRLDLLHRLAEKEKSDLYIFPSSIHECILVPENCMDVPVQELQTMLCEINESIVDEEERLDDIVYRYRLESNRIEPAIM